MNTQMDKLIKGVEKALECREVIREDKGDVRGYSADETTIRLLEVYTGLALLREIDLLRQAIRDHGQTLRNKL
jgi:hypothetical protein